MFWIGAALMAGLTALLIAPALLRSGDGAAGKRAEHDARAFRAQLTEIDQDVARGVLSEAEAAAARIEVSRRLLAADEAARTEIAPQRTGAKKRMAIAAALTLAMPAAALALYGVIGAPGLPDSPMSARASADRPSQATAEAAAPAQPDAGGDPQMVALVEQAMTKLAENPDDLQGLKVIAPALRRLGRHREAWPLYQRILDRTPDAPADLWAAMGESMVMSAEGYVSPQAEAAFDRALAIDPKLALARHYRALAAAQTGRVQESLDRWATLLEEEGPAAPWYESVREMAAQAATELRIDPDAVLPPSLRPKAPGPNAEQMRAAADMTPDEQREMILGMVEGLAEKLKENPADMAGWGRLMGAYGVLGSRFGVADAGARIDAGLEAARGALGADPAALAQVESLAAAARTQIAKP